MARDLSRRECLDLNFKRAFPLPQSGAFADLLAAIEDPPGKLRPD
jgi:hypothetical protein